MPTRRLAAGLTPLETRREVVLHVADRAQELGYDAFFVAEHTAVKKGKELEFPRAESHKADEAEFIMLKDGQIAFEGNATELREMATRDAYIHAFLN